MSCQILVQSINGSSYTMDVDRFDTVFTVKLKLHKQEGIDIKRQKLIYGYLQLRDGDYLRHYDVTHSQSILMTVIMKDHTSM